MEYSPISSEEIYKYIKILAAERAPSGIEANRAMKFIDILKENNIPENIIKTDNIGNVTLEFSPKTLSKSKIPHIMIIGHLDEIGATVYKIMKNGRLLLQSRGGIENRWLISRGESILTMKGNWINGIILGRTIHAIPPSAREKKIPKIHELEVFVGVDNAEDAINQGIHVGSPVVFEGYTKYLNSEIDKDIILSNSLDNIISLMVLLDIAKYLSNLNNNNNIKITLLAAVREEIGCEGSLKVASELRPDLTVSVDFGVVESDKDSINSNCKFKGGPIVVWADFNGRNVYDYNLAKEFSNIAEQEKIPIQHGVFHYYGSDSGKIQQTLGIPSILLAVPMLAGHNIPEVVSIAEIQKCTNLLIKWIQRNK